MDLKNRFKIKIFCMFLLTFLILNMYLLYFSKGETSIESRNFQYKSDIYYDMLNNLDDNDFFYNSSNFRNDTNTYQTWDYNGIESGLEETEIWGCDEYTESGGGSSSINFYSVGFIDGPWYISFVDHDNTKNAEVYYNFFDLTDIIVEILFYVVENNNYFYFNLIDNTVTKLIVRLVQGSSIYYDAGATWDLLFSDLNVGTWYNFTIISNSGIDYYSYLNGTYCNIPLSYSLTDGFDSFMFFSEYSAYQTQINFQKIIINERPEILFTTNHLSQNDLYQLHFIFNIIGKYKIYGINLGGYTLLKSDYDYSVITSTGISDLYDTLYQSYNYIAIILGNYETLVNNIQVHHYSFNDYYFYNTRLFESVGYPSLLNKIDGFNSSLIQGNNNYLSQSYIFNNSIDNNMNLNLHLDNYSNNYMRFRSFPLGYNYATGSLSTIEYTYLQINLNISIPSAIKTNLTLYYVDDIEIPTYTYDSYLLSNGINSIRIGANKLLWIFSFNFSEVENNFIDQDILISFSDFNIYFDFLGPITYQTFQIQEVLTSLIIFLIIPFMTSPKFKQDLRKTLYPIFMMISSLICYITELIASWMFAIINICLIMILLINRKKGD